MVLQGDWDVEYAQLDGSIDRYLYNMMVVAINFKFNMTAVHGGDDREKLLECTSKLIIIGMSLP